MADDEKIILRDRINSEIITSSNGERMIVPKGYKSLEDVHKVFSKWLKLSSDYKLLDTVLAIMLNNKSDGIALWLIIVGPSGDCKSEIIISLFINKEETFLLEELTPNTLVSGFSRITKNGKELNYDLAPELDGKVVLIPDMAAILKLHPNDKAKVWAQLRELYDGRAGKATGGSKKNFYEGLRVNLIAASTPAIDSQILIHQDLGTRELLFRTKFNVEETKISDGELMDKVWENEGEEKIMRMQLNKVVREFLKYHTIKKIEIDDKTKEKIKRYTEVLRFMRATTECDSYTGECINIVYPEQPSRSLKQLKRLYEHLMNLDEGYKSEDALACIRHIVRSSCPVNRWNVLQALIEMIFVQGKSRVSISDISQKLRLGVKTIYRELNVLWNLDIIERHLETREYYGKPHEVQYWTLKETGLINSIFEVFTGSVISNKQEVK